MDQFQDKAIQGFNYLKTKAQETVEAQKLAAQIRQLETRRNNCILDLGHRVFVMFEMDRFQPETLKPRVNEIRELNLEIDALHEKSREKKTSEAEEKSSGIPITPEAPAEQEAGEPTMVDLAAEPADETDETDD